MTSNSAPRLTNSCHVQIVLLGLVQLAVVTLFAFSSQGAVGGEVPPQLAAFFKPPLKYANDDGEHRSPLETDTGEYVQSADQWRERRQALLAEWQRVLGPWPKLIEDAEFRVLSRDRIDSVDRYQGYLPLGIDGQEVPAFLMVPDAEGPFPAVVVVYYDAESGAGLGTPLRDFGIALARRGFVALSIAPPGTAFMDSEVAGKYPPRTPYFGPPGGKVETQPLSALAYTAANAHAFLAARDDVQADRIGIVGHSFGGKWAMFASCLYEPFACAVWSDPGIVFDERDRRKENPGGSVNYWDPWYLGMELGEPVPEMSRYRFRGLPSESNPRTGSYRELLAADRNLVELHALMAPRPFLVSGGTADMPERWAALNHTVQVNRVLGYDNRVAMTNRREHAPTTESNQQVYAFLQWFLQGTPPGEP